MKVFVTIFVLCIFLIGTFFVFTSSTANKLGECSNNTRIEINKIYSSKHSDLDDYEKCIEGLNIIEDASECYLSVEGNGPIPFEVYERMEILMNPEYIKLDRFKDIHNEKCLYESFQLN